MSQDLPAHTYKATMPDGTVFTRKTHRVYTHVIAYKSRDKWVVQSWAGRPDLAESYLAQFRRNWNREDSQSIPVDNPRPDDGPKGIYGKYLIEKADGSPIAAAAEYFVLRLDTDPCARAAVLRYADECEGRNPILAAELREWVADIEARV